MPGQEVLARKPGSKDPQPTNPGHAAIAATLPRHRGSHHCMSLNAIAALPLLASLALSYRASPGTVYVAADSRLTSAAPAPVRQVPDDRACKIRVLNDGVVFVGTGNAFFSAQDVRTNIYALAANAARTLPPGPIDPAAIRRVAFAWQAAVHARLLAKLQAEAPADRLQPASHAAIGAIETTGATGSFYAATSTGTVYGITLRVALDDTGALQNIQEPEAQPGYLVATGTNEAKRQALSIASAPAANALAWPRRLLAIESQTIRAEARSYGRRSDIGGPIDLIEITPGGPVWLARKPGCR